MKFNLFLINEIYRIKEKYDIRKITYSTKNKELSYRLNQLKKLTPYLDNKHITFTRYSGRIKMLKTHQKGKVKAESKCIYCDNKVKTLGAKYCSNGCSNKLFMLSLSQEEKNIMYAKAAKSRNYDIIVEKRKQFYIVNPLEKEKLREKHSKQKNTVQPSGLTLAQEAGLKCSITKNTVQPSGLTLAQEAGLKCSITKKSNPKPNHWFGISDAEKKKRLKKQKNSMTETRIKNKTMTPPHEKEDYDIYFEAAKFSHGFVTNNIAEQNLLSKYGVFNCNTNTKGCVRDHLLSRKYGFNNNIPTWIISHPANCEIVLHSENVRRSFTNDNLISLNELINRINNFDRNCQ